MQPKECEIVFRTLMKGLTVFFHKNADAMFCPNCKTLLFKRDRAIDYYYVVGDKYGLVECKQAPTSFNPFDEHSGIRSLQRDVMNAWAAQTKVWLFLLMGDGRLPDGKEAWMVEWDKWLQIENLLRDANVKSLPWKENIREISTYINAQVLLKDYRVSYDKGWYLGSLHPFIEYYTDILVNLKPMFYWSNNNESRD